MKQFKTGHAINANELFTNFNIQKIKTHHSVLKECYNTREKKEIAARVFICALYLILMDIINNNVTFVFPSKQRCQIQMRPVTDDEFKKHRSNGKFATIDAIKTNDTAYVLELMYQRGSTMKSKPIYVSNKMQEVINNKTNEGMRYL